MSCLAARGLRTRSPRRAPNLGRTLAGGAVTLAAYSGLLVVSVRKETYVEAGWTPPAAERLRSYGTVAAHKGATFVHDVAQALTWILTLAAAGDSRGRVLPFRPRAQAPEPTDTPESAPLRKAG